MEQNNLKWKGVKVVIMGRTVEGVPMRYIGKNHPIPTLRHLKIKVTDEMRKTIIQTKINMDKYTIIPHTPEPFTVSFDRRTYSRFFRTMIKNRNFIIRLRGKSV